jgi:hypothetical protein
MTTAINSTKWPPGPISENVKNLISLLYSLVESKDSSVGDRLAREVFAAEGQFFTPHFTASGSAGK